jgi:DNA helicase IV
MDRRVRQVIEAIPQADLSAIRDDEIRSWLRGLPDWTELSSQARYVPSLATVALALNPRAAGDWVGHLIVDEAQDVRPLEWRILTNSLLAAEGQLSLFGDMNQRRSDWTAATWHALACDLELTDDNGQSTVEELANGYRSTKQILQFANRLLPRGARGDRAIMEGAEPHLKRVAIGDRARATVDSAAELASRYSGITAVISVDPTPISNEFRRRQWVRGRLQHSWTSGSRTIVVLHPDEARGLEFDASVVVEPSDFPENVGRQGVLYTSLTRANKELAIVYSGGLPRELRGTTPASPR